MYEAFINKKYTVKGLIGLSVIIPGVYATAIYRRMKNYGRVILIRERYMSLSEEEKDDIRRLMGTQEGRVLAKLLGPDLMQQIRLKPLGASRKRGLAAR